MAVDSTPREMHEKELIERLVDRQKHALSICKELHDLQPNSGWNLLEPQLQQMLWASQKLLHVRGQSRQRLLAGVDEVQHYIGNAMGK